MLENWAQILQHLEIHQVGTCLPHIVLLCMLIVFLLQSFKTWKMPQQLRLLQVSL